MQMIYPNPRNADRYVWVFAANESAVLFGTEVSRREHSRVGLRDPGWPPAGSRPDCPRARRPRSRRAISITTGATPPRSAWLAMPPRAPVPIRFAGRVRPTFLRQTRWIVTSESTSSRMDQSCEVRREGAKLVVQAGNDSGELVPQAKDNFFLAAFGVWIAFQRDAAGKISGFTSAGGGSDFEGRRQ